MLGKIVLLLPDDLSALASGRLQLGKLGQELLLLPMAQLVQTLLHPCCSLVIPQSWSITAGGGRIGGVGTSDCILVDDNSDQLADLTDLFAVVIQDVLG